MPGAARGLRMEVGVALLGPGQVASEGEIGLVLRSDALE